MSGTADRLFKTTILVSVHLHFYKTAETETTDNPNKISNEIFPSS